MKKNTTLFLWIVFFILGALMPLSTFARMETPADTETVTSTTSEYRLFDNPCDGNDALVCWLGEVWRFSQVAILVLAVAAIVMAGIIYMTSAGNPKQIAMAKKIIVGALTGVAVMVLGKFFLVNIIGVEWIW